MSEDLTICDVDPEVIEKAKKLRFSQEKTLAAIIMKIDADKKLVILDEEHEDISVDDLREELPDHLPRYVLYSYIRKHDDGRISYPLVFIFISPQEPYKSCDVFSPPPQLVLRLIAGAKPELQMMYAGSKTNLVKTLGATKDFELRSKEEMSEEWLIQKLKFFR